MGVNGQRLSATDYFVRTLAGLSITLTKAQLQAFFQTTSGSAAARKAATITWGKEQIATACGLDVSQVELDFDGTQTPTVLRTRND